MEIHAGDKVKLKNVRGIGWNSRGKMDCYCGNVVTVRMNFGNRKFRITEDEGFWIFDRNDVVAIIERGE